MQNYQHVQNGPHQGDVINGRQSSVNQYCNVSTQNRFAPLSEWVRYSMAVNDGLTQQEHEQFE